MNKNHAISGFTLVELAIVLLIIGILSAIAMPIYQDHALQGRIVDATNALSTLRVRMEQHYQDNRKYTNTSWAVSPCSSAQTAGDFTISCTVSSATWTGTARGSGQMADFAYSINQDGTRATVSLPAKWGSSASGCWITSKGGTC
jgi:type IV pilus assembly protein PilE